MATPVTVQNNKTGLCPHGLPPSACPICNGGAMSGAGRAKDNVVSKPVTANQWSFMKCYAVGLAMKAQDAKIENAKTSFEKQIEFAKQLGKNIQNIAEKIQNTITNIQNSSPQIIQKALQILNDFIIKPVFNIAMQIPKIFEKIANLQQKFDNLIQQTAEKLTAIIGEIKNFVQKKIIDDTKKKIKKFFFFFITNAEDENYKGDDELEVFKSREIKKYLVKIITKINKQEKNENRSNKE